MDIARGFIGEILLMYEKMGVAVATLAALILFVFAGVLFADRIVTLWRVPRGLLLTFLLGASLALVLGILYAVQKRAIPGLNTRILFFVLLYGWCASGLWFFAGRNTHIIKLSLGLILQAIILCVLFRLT